MRNLFLCLLITLITVGFVTNEANAARFGGGRSFGVQRSSSFFQHRPSSTQSAYAPRANKSRWGHALGGLLVGGLLASLFMGHGLGTGLLSWFILGAVVLFLMSFWRHKMQPGMQFSSVGNPRQFSSDRASNEYSSSSVSAYPRGFTPERFLRDAKVTFIRLQAAYDQGNLDDLNEFTAPEVFAEIKMQLEERGNQPNRTEVCNLDAQLLDVSNEGGSSIASVRFTGSIKENDAPFAPLNEIWNFRQFSPIGHWLVAGIEQC